MDRINVVLKDIVSETADAYSLVLENHPGLSDYEAGQFVNVFCNVDGNEIQRSYSFSSSPLVDSYPSLTIKMVLKGKMSNYLQATLRKGSAVVLSKPLGRFLLDTEPMQSHVFFIAGGSGITPIFSLLKEALKRLPDTHFTLLYANHNKHIIFQKVLDNLASKHRYKLAVHYFVKEGRIKAQMGTQVHPGRITKEFLKTLFAEHEIPAKDSRAYICGPAGMMEDTLLWLMDSGIKKDKIRTEYFVPTKPTQRGNMHLKEETSQVTLKNFKGSEIVLSVSRETDILSGFLDNGHDLPHSCREAMCGSCAVKLLRGHVEMKENYALNDAKLAEGYVLLCQSFPLSGEVVLEYDLGSKKS